MFNSLVSIYSSLSGNDQALKNALIASLMRKVWKNVVNEPINRFSEPVFYQSGVLTIRVDSPAWAQQLSLLSHSILGKLRQALKDDSIKLEKLKFQVQTEKLKEEKFDLQAEVEKACFQIKLGEEETQLLEGLPQELKQRLTKIVQKKEFYKKEKKDQNAKTCEACGFYHNERGNQCSFCCQAKKTSYFTRVYQLLGKTPWITFSQAKEQIPEIKIEDFNLAKGRCFEQLNQELFLCAMQIKKNQKDDKTREAFRVKIIHYVMLASGKPPQKIFPEEIKKTLPRKWLKVAKESEVFCFDGKS